MKPVIGIPVSAAKKLNEAAHTFAWVTDQEATATEAGAKHEECTVCGYAKTAMKSCNRNAVRYRYKLPADRR